MVICNILQKVFSAYLELETWRKREVRSWFTFSRNSALVADAWYFGRATNTICRQMHLLNKIEIVYFSFNYFLKFMSDFHGTMWQFHTQSQRQDYDVLFYKTGSFSYFDHDNCSSSKHNSSKSRTGKVLQMTHSPEGIVSVSWRTSGRHSIFIIVLDTSPSTSRFQLSFSFHGRGEDKVVPMGNQAQSHEDVQRV
jgi:hypothetical protein